MSDTPENITLKLPITPDDIERIAPYIDSSMLMRLAELHDGASSKDLTARVIASLPDDAEMFRKMSMGQPVTAKIQSTEHLLIELQMLSSADVEESTRRAIKAADGAQVIYQATKSRWLLASALLSINGTPDTLLPALPMFADDATVKTFNEDRERRIAKMYAQITRLADVFVRSMIDTQAVFEREVGNRFRVMDPTEALGNSTRTPNS